jgi:Tol biopolymer transport system component
MTTFSRLLAPIALALGACRDLPFHPESPTGETRSASSLASGSTFILASTIALTSTRDDPAGNPLLTAEVYLLNPDGTNARRLTANGDGDAFPTLSPNGKLIVFDSNRRRVDGEALNTSDLFVMNADGSGQVFLTRGSSASWSPDGKNIVYHASASGTGTPIKPDPGAATFDSDIFIVNVDDLLEHAEPPRNITNSPATIDDDPDWSPDGQKIVFTSHDVTDNPINSVTAEIYVISTDGTGLTRLTSNTEEERGPSWSPDGTRIVLSCRRGGSDFEICVMNADGSGQLQLTDNTVGDLTATFSPDGEKILFHRPVTGQLQLWTMNADGTGQTQLTGPPGLNALANWGELRVHVK